MPGLPGRSYTAYDVYRDYNSEDLLDDMYPLEGAHYPGSQTPLNHQNGRASATDFGRTTPHQQNGSFAPMKVIYPSNRPKSRTRSLGRPPSRVNVSIQDFYSLPSIETETQRTYAMPDASLRPTSPVQRLLERSHTQPMINLESLPGNEMDPITRQYYHRYWSAKSPSIDSSLYRYGRAGGVWRHVRACVANTGTQIAFIDGTVKQEDNVYFPPYKKSSAKSKPFLISSQVPVSQHVPQTKTYNNRFSKHAREGFKYWYQEPKPIDLRECTVRFQ